MYCKSCGAQLQQGMLICPECGARQRHRVKTVRCAYCHGRASVEMTMCPHCGRDLHPAGPRWGLWLTGAAIVILVGLWGLGRLPVERVWQEVVDTRARLARLVQIPDLSASTATPMDSGLEMTPVAIAVAPTPNAPTGAKEPTTPAITATSPPPTETPAPAPTETATAIQTTAPSPTVDEGAFYTVRSGDTLQSIAARSDIPWQLLAAENGLNEFSILQPGQKLRVPKSTATSAPTSQPTATRQPTAAPSPAATATATPTPTPTATKAETVSIARAVTSAPTTSPSETPTRPVATATSAATVGPQTYRVQAGDSLASIGARFGVQWEAIAAVNGLSEDTVLSIGQTLTIPAPGAPIPSLATPRPTAIVTPSPTSAPELAAPELTSPADQAPYSGSDAYIELVWEPVPGFSPGNQIQVTLQWVERGAPQTYAWYTTANSSRVPLWVWGHADQPSRRYQWHVTVVQLATDGQGGEQIIPLSAPSETRTFSWN